MFKFALPHGFARIPRFFFLMQWQTDCRGSYYQNLLLSILAMAPHLNFRSMDVRALLGFGTLTRYRSFTSGASVFHDTVLALIVYDATSHKPAVITA